MMTERKQSACTAAVRLALAPLILWFGTALPLSSPAAQDLPPGVAEALRQAADQSVDTFRAALRQAIAAAPQRRDAILRHALAAHPERAAKLLLTGLYQPPLLPPDMTQEIAPGTAPHSAPEVAADHTTNRPAALPRASVVRTDDTPEAIEEEGPWNGTITLGATVRTGTTDNAGATGEVSVAYEEAPWLHRARVSLDYLRDRARTLEQAIVVEYEARHEVDERSFGYGLARYEDDRFSGFDFEFISSAGLGRHLIQEPGHLWTVTLGPTLRVSQRSDSGDRNEAPGARLTNLLSWDLSDVARLQNQTEALADTERVRVNNDVVLKVRIIDELSGQFSFGFVYRSDTPENAENTDTTTRATLVYDF